MSSLPAIFDILLAHYGPRHWWPAETPFEVCVGAILTQNTNWRNVERAIVNLRRVHALTPQALQQLDGEELAELIRPAGFYNVKSRRLREFVGFLFRCHQGDLAAMFAGDWQKLRGDLLAVSGIGPETADSILLYAGNQPTFVVDAYTRRLMSRLGLCAADIGYEELRQLFMSNLPPDTPLYNEYHALIVEQCKVHCTARPRCAGCPLKTLCLQ
jgi:endonuclease-3 related protein